MRYRDVDESIMQKFQDLYSAGYSPAAAYQLHQYDLLNIHGADYYLTSGDRRFCPDKSWCYRFDNIAQTTSLLLTRLAPNIFFA